MGRFYYRAARADGTVVEAWADGDSEQAIRAQLEGEGWLLLSLGGERGRAAGRPGGGLPWRRRRLSLREFLVFNQELLALVKAGLPILKTCELLADRAANPDFKAALQGVRTAIRGGASISEALGQYPVYFPEVYRASLRAGEQTGNVAEVLRRYISYLKLLISVREKVAKALAYPAFLVTVGIAVVAFLMTYVVPTFADIYQQNQSQLPLPTQMLLRAVAAIQQGLSALLLGGVGLAVAAHRWVRTPIGRAWADRVSLRLPVLGDILLKNQIIRLARTLATMLAGGIPLLTALQITRGALTNTVLAEALARATDRLRDGTSLADALRSERFLPPMSLEMIEVGETTGSLETMLQDIAEFHESELDLRLSQITTWIEPVLLLVMGVLVGGVVIIMYLPVFQLAGTV
ncbi:type II secretion system F family protein [Nitrospira sp. Kam-Ns4a]